MTDDGTRVLTALRAALDADAAVSVAWPETQAGSPAAVLPPAKRVPVCSAGGETLLTEITQTVCLSARSFERLNRLTEQAETAMRGLGYTLVDMRTDRKLPRAVTLVFRSVTDGVFFSTEKE